MLFSKYSLKVWDIEWIGSEDNIGLLNILYSAENRLFVWFLHCCIALCRKSRTTPQVLDSFAPKYLDVVVNVLSHLEQ